jgi:hypothetical protein
MYYFYLLAVMFGFSIGHTAATVLRPNQRIVSGSKLCVGRTYVHCHSRDLKNGEYYGRLLRKEVAYEEDPAQDLIFYVGKFDKNGEYIERYFWSIETFLETLPDAQRET